MRGEFILEPSRRRPIILPNTIVEFGANAVLEIVFQALTPLGATFYLGLTQSGYTFDGTTLAGMAAGEPVGNGYARQAITRNNTDWTLLVQSDVVRARSKTCTFTATAEWSKTWQRMFLCDAAAGTSGNVFAVSAATPSPIQVLSGQGPSIAYDFYLRG